MAYTLVVYNVTNVAYIDRNPVQGNAVSKWIQLPLYLWDANTVISTKVRPGIQYNVYYNRTS